MMQDAGRALLDRTPPAWVRKIEAAALMGAFARAFDVEPPEVEELTADEALWAFREFTAACMEAALADAKAAAAYRTRLGEVARELGCKMRRLLPFGSAQAFILTRYFYRGIGIELAGELPASLCFGPCSFAQRYTPADCWFMSAFDEGFICGISGMDGTLRFECRLTEGAACCRAELG